MSDIDWDPNMFSEGEVSDKDEDRNSDFEPGPSKKRKRGRPMAKVRSPERTLPTSSNLPLSIEVKNIGGLPIPRKLWDKLKPHQKDGVQWMWKRIGHDHGAILGDEMGLGKTIQIITILAGLHQDKTLRNVLIIVPATLQKHWIQEFDKWTRGINVRIYNSGRIRPNHVYITSYEKVRDDATGLLDVDWNIVVCDEGHRLRNPKSLTTRNIKRINCAKRVLLTGSPIMNSLTELWSLIDFSQPGLLGKLEVFSAELAIPIQQGSLAGSNHLQIVTGLRCAEELRSIVKPLLLRRLKSDIQEVFVEKSDNVLFIKMTEEQDEVYRRYLRTERVKDALLGGAHCFGILQKLRQLVSHPFFLGDETGKVTDNQIYRAIRKPTQSGKMQALMSLLGGWRKQKRKILVFTHSLPSLKMITGMCEQNNLPVLSICGHTAVGSRQMLIDEFNDSCDAFCMVMTSRVGGVGLNIHGATRTVIFEPDWNPGQDEQAAARIHRPQQTEKVSIYRLITSDSIEEWIYQRQIYKHNVAQHALSNKHNDQRLFAKASMASLLFGKGDTAETLKSIGADIKINKKKTKTDLEKAAEKVAEEEENSLSKSLRKVYKKFPNLKPKKTTTIDGETIVGLHSSSTIETGKSKDYGKTEDWVLQRLFKKAGCVFDTAVDQTVIKQGTDYRKIDEEAQRVAKAAVAALHKNAKKPKVKVLKSIGSSSASALQRIRQRRSVADESESPVALPDDVFKESKLNPNSKLAHSLRDYIEEFYKGPTSDDLIAKFDGHVNDKAIFKALLKQIAELNPKTRRWTVRPQYET